MIKLYHWWASSHSFKTRLVLAEKGLSYESHLINLGQREQKDPAYLKIHPYGLVPAIDDDGFIVYDSTMIAEYLEDKYPQVPLMPADAAGRARVRMLEDYRDMHVHPVFRIFIAELRQKPQGQADMDRVNETIPKFQQMMARLEPELAGGAFLCGDYSIADTAFGPYLQYFEAWKLPLPENCPRVKEWVRRCMERPSYATALGSTS